MRSWLLAGSLAFLAACRAPGMSGAAVRVLGSVTLPSQLVSTGGAALISPNGSGIVSNNASSLISSNASHWRIAGLSAVRLGGATLTASRWIGRWQAAGQTRTGSDGSFGLDGLESGEWYRFVATGSVAVAPARLVRLDPDALTPAVQLGGAWSGYAAPARELTVNVELGSTLAAAAVEAQISGGNTGILDKVSNAQLGTLDQALSAAVTPGQVQALAAGSTPLSIYQQLLAQPTVAVAAENASLPGPASPPSPSASSSPASSPAPSPSPSPSASPVPLSITGFSPPSGAIGTVLTLSGTGFSPTAAADQVTLDGVSATVTGATATSLTVSVPNAPSGPIAVSVGGQTVDSATSFTSTTTIPGNFVTSGVTLVSPRAEPTWAEIGGYLYVIGGWQSNWQAENTIDRAPVAADGTLGAFMQLSGTLTTARAGAGSAVTSSYLYVFGGSGASVERAPINNDGSLGAFSAAGIALNVARTEFATIQADGFVYVIGGMGSGTTALTSIERAPINADGTLGSFVILPSSLQTPRTRASARLIGNQLYVFGGETDSGQVPINGVEVATLAPDGSLGSFASYGAGLVSALSRETAVTVGNSLDLLGGNTYSGFTSTIEQADIGTGNALAGFVNAIPALAVTRGYFIAPILGTKLYVIGGSAPSDGQATTSIEMVTLP